MKNNILEPFFRLAERKTNWRLECLAGLTTFLTMSYIIFVNAHILEAAGMNFGAVFVVTCLVTALGSFLVGILANYPIAVAPGLALSVYFSFVIVQGLGYSWQEALGMTFVSGLLFLICSLTKKLEYLIKAIPHSLHIGLSVGIGIFIIIIGLKNAELLDIQGHVSVLTQNFFTLQTGLFLLGLIFLFVWEYLQWNASIALSIIFITLASLYFHLTQFHGVLALPPSIHMTWMQLDCHHLFSFEKLSIIFVFFLITLFDATGTFIGLLNDSTDKKMPKALFADSVATVAGSFLGSSSTSPFIESAAGIRAGGRTGLTSIVTAVLFLASLFIFPLAEAIPSYATAPALLYVGFMMTSYLRKIDFKNFWEVIPSILTAVMIPIRFSIVDGVVAGVLSYCFIKLITNQRKDINHGLIVLCVIFIIFLGTQFFL